MKHILLVSFFLLLNMLAFAQALQVRSSSNPQTESVGEPTQLTNYTQINDIQAMVRRNDPSHMFIARGREKIIVEEQVLFIPNGDKTKVIGKFLKESDASNGNDSEIVTELNRQEDATKEKSEQSTIISENEFKSASISVGSAFKSTTFNRQNAAQNQDKDAYLRISPNPINDAAVVEIENTIHGTFQVFDITGRLLNRGQFEGNQFILERKNLNKGVYILRVLDKNSVIGTKKIVVN
jgi:Secretion system C-terminal sorting domain